METRALPLLEEVSHWGQAFEDILSVTPSNLPSFYYTAVHCHALFSIQAMTTEKNL